MITLDAMNAKLDALTAGMNSVLATLEQGNKWAREQTEAIQKERGRQHRELLLLIEQHDSKFTEHFTSLFDGNAAVIGKFNEFIEKIKHAAAAPRRSKKVRPVKRRGRSK